MRRPAPAGLRFAVSIYFDRTVENACYINVNSREIRIPADFRPMFSKKSIGEIVLADRTKAPDDMNGLAVTVYRIRDGKAWPFGASDISGGPTARIGANKIFIPRNFRGFIHVWTVYRDSFQCEETD